MKYFTGPFFYFCPVLNRTGHVIAEEISVNTTAQADPSPCKLSGRFSLWEKVYAQVSFLTMGIIGTVAIIQADWVFVLPYLLIYWYGIPGVVMHRLVCPRCPHLHTYNDCLQLPVFLTRLIVRTQKTAPFSPMEKTLFYSIFILIPLYPLYWLWGKPVLLAIFILSGLAWYTGQFVYFCKRCRVKQCPFNRSGCT